jgi:nucleoside-diphosphate-sugar epimerase
MMPGGRGERCIVITGARGYIGSALVRRLAQEEVRLRLVSRLPGQGGAALGKAQVEHVTADLCDDKVWSSLIEGADAIVHLSSRTDLRAAEADPDGDERINVEPVRALVRAAKTAQAPPKIVFASVVTIVGDRHANPVDEQTPNAPCSIYDRHKLACETILREATRQGLLRACSLRLCNVYGYGGASINTNRGMLNAMMERALRGEALTPYGDGRYIRDFIHLSDVVEAFCAALDSERIFDGSAYVIASGEGHSLADAFAMIAAEARRQTGRHVPVTPRPEPADLHRIEKRNFVGNSSLFQQLTGWRPKIDLAAGIHDYFSAALSVPDFAPAR